MKTAANDPLKTRYLEPLLVVENLSKSYVQHRPLTHTQFTIHAFQNVHLVIHDGTTLALVGDSGSGKSTLAKCMALLERPTSGEMWFEGKNLGGLGRPERFRFHRAIQLIFQDPSSALNPRLTAAEILLEPLQIQRIGTKQAQQRRAMDLMEQVGLPWRARHKGPLEFSGGERQRLAIARALALEPKLLILDEALSGLDLRNQQIILELLEDLRTTHSHTYLHISHDLQLVSQFAEEVAVMCEGSIVECKPSADLFERPEHACTKALLAAMPSLESIGAARQI